jgi:3-phenylpropionate/trans-cinnamate dioxygenase ferredoxin subunit
MTLVRVAATSDIPEGEARGFTVDGAQIAVVNLGDGEFRAVGDVCSHAHAFLHEGEVDTDFETVECPKHGSTFDLETGRPRTLPATMPVPAYKVKIENDEILIEVNGGVGASPAPRQDEVKSG